MIYFIRNTTNGAVKIGQSRNPAKRFSVLQTASPDLLEMLGTNRMRPSGEWFRGDPEFLEAIHSLMARRSRRPLSPVAPVPGATADFFRRQGCIFPELCERASAAVGFAVAIWQLGHPSISSNLEYQVMVWDDYPGRPGMDFWDRYVCYQPQFHDTPEEACSVFATEYWAWVDRWYGAAS
jgi:hypothetical protein